MNPDSADPECPAADSGDTSDASPPPDPGPTEGIPTPRPITDGRGSRIGPYKLLQPIGEGGMGVVYMAEQETPVRRRVALKIIKPGMDTGQVIARFEAERQALALMDHQHIATVLDAGATAAGRPYFVMELVKGVPITDYCNRNHLTPRERLELFVPVCQAIQHAHQKGIIHRDIKPSNVLVTLYDGKPVAKVIDFGVAKATDQRLTERTMFTQLGQIIGTLEYMSPEQAEMGTLDIDTRSDIYSLGVVLYELLTGSTPLERARLREAGYVEILRRIREEEPTRPSTRLSETNAASATISAERKTEPARLAKLVRGELDWIVMKALEKDRTRRYETADGLARDIERYLHDEPVEAGPPSASYRLRKFTRKHRVLLTTTASFVGLLVVGALVSTVLAVRASRAESATKRALIQVQDEQSKTQTALARATDEERKARRSANEARTVLEFFQEKVLAATRPKDQEGGLGKDATIRAAVDAAEPLIATEFRDQPTAEASIRDALGTTYWYLGEAGLTIRQFERSRQLRRDTLGPDHPETLSSMGNLAVAYRDAGRLADAVPLFEETLKLHKVKLGPDHPETLTTMNNLASAYQAAGRLGEGLPMFEETLTLRKAKLGRNQPGTLYSMYNLASAYRAAGRLDEALSLSEEVLKGFKAKLGLDHPDTLTATNDLGLAYQAAGRLDQAMALFAETLKGYKAKLGSDHPHTLAAMHNLGLAYRAAGRLGEALPLFEEALKLRTTKLGPDHPDTLISMEALAVAHEDAGRLAEALPRFEETLKKYKAKLGPDHPDTLLAMTNLARAYRVAGRPGEALPLSEEAAKGFKSKLGADHANTLQAMNNLAGAYLDALQWADAEMTARECLGLLEKKQPDEWLRFHTMSQLGAALAGRKKYAEAEPLLLQGYEGLKAGEAKIPAPRKKNVAEAAARIVPFYEAWGKPEKAADWRTKLTSTPTEKKQADAFGDLSK